MKIRFLIIVGLLLSTLSFAEEPKQKELGLSDLVGKWEAVAKDGTVTFEYTESGTLTASWDQEKLQAVCDAFTKAKNNSIVTENILLVCRGEQGRLGMLIKFVNEDQIATRADVEDEDIVIFNRKK